MASRRRYYGKRGFPYSCLDDICGGYEAPACLKTYGPRFCRFGISIRRKEKETVSTTEFPQEVPVSEQSGAKAPALYQGFDGQYIDGSWRPGKHGGVQCRH